MPLLILWGKKLRWSKLEQQNKTDFQLVQIQYGGHYGLVYFSTVCFSEQVACKHINTCIHLAFLPQVLAGGVSITFLADTRLLKRELEQWWASCHSVWMSSSFHQLRLSINKHPKTAPSRKRNIITYLYVWNRSHRECSELSLHSNGHSHFIIIFVTSSQQKDVEYPY